MRLETLKRRAEFARVRGGGRCATAAFVLEGKAREESRSEAAENGGPRFGFTVTRRIGGAVVRNRARRRLKSAVLRQAPHCADAAFDYVIVARPAALDRPFEALEQDFAAAFARVHGPQRQGPRRGAKTPTQT